MVISLFGSFIRLDYTDASQTDTSVVISKIQTGGSGSGTTLQEYVQIFNNSNEEVDITNWCLQFSVDTNIITSNYREIFCLKKTDPGINYMIEPFSYGLFVSPAFNTLNPLTFSDGIFTVTSNMPGTNGSIRLIDSQKNTIDTVGWGSGIAEGIALSELDGGKIFMRKSELLILTDTNINASDFMTISSPGILESGGVSELVVEVDVCVNIDGLQTDIPEDYLLDQNNLCKKDMCSNIDGLQEFIPPGYESLLPATKCSMTPLESAVLFITEILPNAPSSDTGREFIEIYNPNTRAVDLEGYILQVGPSYTKQYEFKSGTIGSRVFFIISDSVSGIVLPNSSGVSLRLIAPNGDTVSSSDTYYNANDDVSWALVDDQWIYTNQITPESANKPYIQPVELEVIGVTSLLAPCPAGKYRNTETNRCRNIETAVSQLTACDEDEYRNPETNRCRKISVASVLAACAEGQERNPETNRCRKISVLGVSDSDIPTITDIASENTSGQIRWDIIAITLLATLGYIVYEWRKELNRSYSRLRQKLVQ
jgi:hypothetical protein